VGVGGGVGVGAVRHPPLPYHPHPDPPINREGKSQDIYESYFWDETKYLLI
jgi:hypothetical protein